MTRQLLWVVPKCPLPARDGARVATTHLLQGLSAQGALVKLLIVAGTDEEIDAAELRNVLGVQEVLIVRRSPTALTRAGKALKAATNLVRAPQVPVSMAAYQTAAVRRFIEQALAGERWSALVYDGLHPAAHALWRGCYRRPSAAPKIVYRAHNHEATLWRQRANTAQGLLKSFFNYQANLVDALERSLVQAAFAVCPVSNEDAHIFSAACPTAKVQVVPIGHDFGSGPTPLSEDRPGLLYLGRLDWPPNREGLEWFLENVWPKILKENSQLQLMIAGSGDGRWLERFKELPQLEFHGMVKDVGVLYRRALVTIVPIFTGSGTRVKAIEAARYGRACFSTALGVEGLPLIAGESYLKAETVDEWVRGLVAVDRNRVIELGRLAHAALATDYAIPSAATQFLKIFDLGLS